MHTKAHRSRSFFALLFSRPSRDYLERRRWSRMIFSTLVIVFLSVLVAAAIIYTSNPSSFGSASH